MRNLAIILPLKSKLSGKFLRFSTIDVQKYWKVVEFRKISVKMKNCKIFYETQTLSHLKEIIQLSPPHRNPYPHPYPTLPIPPDKILCVFETKLFSEGDIQKYKVICRYLLLKCFKKVVLGRQEMMHCKCFFLTLNRNKFAGKFVNWESFLAVFWKHIIFNFKRVEIRKMSEVFLEKLYCKMSDLFR